MLSQRLLDKFIQMPQRNAHNVFLVRDERDVDTNHMEMVSTDLVLCIGALTAQTSLPPHCHLHHLTFAGLAL